MVKILFLLLLLVNSLSAVVWRADLPEPPREAKAEMQQVGKVHYSTLQILGGSCVAIGGPWVLTSRHGTEDWKAGSLRLSFPALGKDRYRVKKIHFPKKGDLALIELTKKVAGAKQLTLFAGNAAKKGQRVWIGGFGLSGPLRKVGLPGEFHAGFNRVDGLRRGKISISMSGEEDPTREEQEAIITAMDSGSPLFLRTKKGWELAGIASSASNRWSPEVGDRASFARVSQARLWIKGLVKP